MGQRAKMSDRAARENDPRFDRTSDAAAIGARAAWALDEATRILAETEGWDGTTYHGSDRVEWNHFPHGHGLKAERAALADALRAFVEGD